MVQLTALNTGNSWFSAAAWRHNKGETKSVGQGGHVHPESVGNVPNEPRQWTAFESADALEMGMGPGLASTYVEPPFQSTEEQHLRVNCSENGLEYTLVTGKGDALLHARGNHDATRYEIFIGRDESHQNHQGPAFILQGNQAQDEWSLKATRCDRCEAQGKRKCGVRELAQIKHYCEAIGDGQAFCVDLTMPDIRKDGCAAVFCDVCGDASSSSDVRYLTTRRPKWNPKHKSLTLDFRGRCSMASARNFMLEDPEKPGKTKLLFGKVGEHQFALDYKHPLGAVQAFATSLSASHWI